MDYNWRSMRMVRAPGKFRELASVGALLVPEEDMAELLETMKMRQALLYVAGYETAPCLSGARLEVHRRRRDLEEGGRPTDEFLVILDLWQIVKLFVPRGHDLIEALGFLRPALAALEETRGPDRSEELEAPDGLRRLLERG